MRYLLLICITFVMAGCVGNSTTKKGAESVRAGYKTQAEIVEPASIVKGEGNTVNVYGNIPTTSRNITTSSDTDMQSSYSVVTTVSLGANLILLGIGLLLLKMVFKGSKAASLTAGLLDSGIASAISMATASTDHKDIAAHNHLRGELESLKRYMP